MKRSDNDFPLEHWSAFGKLVIDIDPAEMAKAAGVDWEVTVVPCYYEYGEKRILLDKSSLLGPNGMALDTVPNSWKPVQNTEVVSAFATFCKSINSHIEWIGTLRENQILWCLAPIHRFNVRDESFVAYALCSNQHKWGTSTDMRVLILDRARLNTVVVVTRMKARHQTDKPLVFPTDTNFKKEVGQIVHRFAEEAMKAYSKWLPDENVAAYFGNVFPITGKKEINSLRDLYSKNAHMACSLYNNKHPKGGTWWDAYNIVAHSLDHVLGRDIDTRTYYCWYGHNRQTKLDALKVAATQNTL